MQDFTLWLEFKHVDYATKWVPKTETFITSGEWDKANELCNVEVELSDGRHYRVNGWTYGFLATVVTQNIKDNQNLQDTYQVAPDQFVQELTRECVEATIAELLSLGNLEDALNPTGLSKSMSD